MFRSEKKNSLLLQIGQSGQKQLENYSLFNNLLEGLLSGTQMILKRNLGTSKLTPVNKMQTVSAHDRQGWAHFFCTGPNNEYSGLCQPCNLCCNYSILPSQRQSSHSQYKNFVYKTGNGLTLTQSQFGSWYMKRICLLITIRRQR